MKHKFTCLFFLSALAITSCSQLKSNTAIHSLMSKDRNVIELSVGEMANLVEHNYGVSILFYSLQCSYCDKARESLKEMAKKYDYALFQLEMNRQVEEYIQEDFKQVNLSLYHYPTLFLFENNELSYYIDNENLLNYSSLRRILIPQLFETETFYQDINNL